MCEAIPKRDFNDRNHEYIWDYLAFELTSEDFDAIQMALIEREDDLKRIEESSVNFRAFDKKDPDGKSMFAPGVVSDYMKDGARRYIDWDCAEKIWRILSKYAEFYSKS